MTDTSQLETKHDFPTSPLPCVLNNSNAQVRLRSNYSCNVIRASELDEPLLSEWRRLRVQNPDLWSPFFSPEFTQAVGAVREDSFVAVIDSGNEVVGFLPFHRDGKTLFPIGRSINDAHGIIAADSNAVSWRWLLQTLGAVAYRYHALFSQPADTAATAFGWHRTFLCDLTLSESGYLDWLQSNRRTIKKQARKTKKLVKDVGPVRLEFASRDHSMLDAVLRLKSQQYQRTRIFDIFSVDWIRDLMHHLLDHRGEIEGRLSVYFAGDRKSVV